MNRAVAAMITSAGLEVDLMDDRRQIDLLAADEVPDGTMKMAWVEDGTTPVLVVNIAGEYLDQGFLTGESITCALHLSRFDLATGEALDPPAVEPLARYEVELVDGRIFIRVPQGPLATNG